MTQSIRSLIIWLLGTVLLFSLPYAYYLTFPEYARILVLGLLVLSLALAYRERFAQAYWRRALAGLVLAYLTYACDPIAAGSFDATRDNPTTCYIYVLLTAAVAGCILLGVFFSVLSDRHLFAKFLRGASGWEWAGYILALVLLSLISAAEAIGMSRSGQPFLFSMLSGLKPLIALLFFLAAARLVVKPVSRRHDDSGDEEEEERELSPAMRRLTSFNILVLGILIFAAYTTIFGAAKVGIAVGGNRLSGRLYAEGEKAGPEFLDKVVSAYSLCDEEAARIYRLGYLAGNRQWSELEGNSAEALNRRRFLETESLICSMLGQTQDFQAAHFVDSLPRNHQLLVPAITQHFARLSREAQNSPRLLYTLARLQNMAGNFHTFRVLINNYRERFPLDPNAAIVSGTLKKLDGQTYTLPCETWLAPMEDAMVERTLDEVIMQNGRSMAGWLWLPRGKYQFTLYARDEGADHEKAKEVNFDPTCKAEAWICGQSAQFKIYSERRDFQPYQFEMEITETPALFTILFTNDRDEGKGLDRNLGLHRLDIQCAK